MGYHFTSKTVSRAKGHSMVAKAAYNSRSAITEERTHELKDYSRHHDTPLATFVYAPDPELRNPEALWNFYERHETRSNAQLGMSFIASLPHELTDEQRANIVKDFMREQFSRKGVAAQADIHRPDREGDDRNFHVHILAGLRKVEKGGLAERAFTYEDRKKNLADWREKWAERGARELEKAGFKLQAERWRYGHLTNDQQKKKALARADMEWAEIKGQEAKKHLGPASAMERRGTATERGNFNRNVAALYGKKAERQSLDRRIQQEKEKLSRSPQSREEERERAAPLAAASSRAIGAKNRQADAMRRDGLNWWQRPSVRRSRLNVGKQFDKYWQEHVIGEQERGRKI